MPVKCKLHFSEIGICVIKDIESKDEALKEIITISIAIIIFTVFFHYLVNLLYRLF